MATLITSDQFKELFSQVLTDSKVRQDLQSRGVGALRDHGLATDMSPEIEQQLNNIQQVEATSRCGTCGVCGLCTLCGEINAGSGSAFLWATFFLGETNLAAPSA